MVKEYEFVCWECFGIYTTQDKQMPLCRGCQSKHALKVDFLSIKEIRLNIIKLYGTPTPTPKQAARWRAIKRATRLIKGTENNSLEDQT